MNWRPWIVLTALIIAVVSNAAFILTEEELKPDEKGDIKKGETYDELRLLTYTASNRRDNFKRFGLNSKQAQMAARRASRLVKDQRDRLNKALSDGQTELSGVFCAGSADRLPERYEALGYLVTQDGDRRGVLSGGRVVYLQKQEWFDVSGVGDLYDTLDAKKTRKRDATVMVLAAVLLNKEQEAFEEEPPWSPALGVGQWGWRPLQKQYPKATEMVIDYVALMHVLTELARGSGGICN